jgi:hypothetical protein
MMDTVGYQLSVEEPSVDTISRHICRSCSSGAGLERSEKPYGAGVLLPTGAKAAVQNGLGG